MGVVEILSSRREYTKLNPFVVLLGKGEHQITSSWNNPSTGNEYATTLNITRSNITFLGTGKDTTTILGGFRIQKIADNNDVWVDVENITFKLMTVTNTSDGGTGIFMSSAKVELSDVAVNGCGGKALHLSLSSSENTVVATRCEFANSGGCGAFVDGSSTSATFNNCVFNDNDGEGIIGGSGATIHLHGEATAIHSNKQGINAYSAKVVIHLPSHHNTFYNNTMEDRRTFGGGTITNVED